MINQAEWFTGIDLPFPTHHLGSLKTEFLQESIPPTLKIKTSHPNNEYIILFTIFGLQHLKYTNNFGSKQLSKIV